MAVSLNNISIINKVNEEGLGTAVDYLLTKCPSKINRKVLHLQIDRLVKKYKHLVKDKNRVKGGKNLQEFCDKVYEYPVSKSSDEGQSSSGSGSGSSGIGSSGSSSGPFSFEHDNPKIIAMAYKDAAEKLSVELNETRKGMEKSESIERAHHEMSESMKTVERKLEFQRRDLKRTATRENYWREKCRKLEQTVAEHEQGYINIPENDNLNRRIEELTEKNKNYKTEIQDLNHTIAELRNEIDILNELDSENVYLFDEEKKEFVPSLHACVYTLLNNHVSTEHVSDVIKCVLKLVNKYPNRLPSKSTVKNWSLERGLIARKHIGETAQNKNTTLHTDEASKYGQKWGAFANRDEEGNYLLIGMRDMATKSSKDTLDTFKDIIKDLDAASTTERAGQEVLINIKNTMSDRASTEKKFNELLKYYKDEVLPQVMETYEDLNDESKQAISHMNNFFCGLHSLVHMAETAQKILYETEMAHFDGNVPIENRSFIRAGQAGTIRLLQTSCKAFARRGDQKNGCHGNFTTFVKPFLAENGFLSLPIQPLRGNRFNILFVNAGHVFFFKEKMVEYLSSSPNLNGLLQSVLKDLKEDYFIAGLKTLGLVSKMITTPLWHVIEDKGISIGDMAQRYADLKAFLDKGLDNILDIMTGEARLFEDVEVKHDKVFEKLIQPDDTIDDYVVTMLSVLLPALSKLVQHEFGDHLPGGIHEDVDQETTKSTDKHNKFPERVFAYVDYLLAQKPNISSLALESQITFSLNKTDQWLQSKSREEAEKIIAESRKEVRKERERFKIREVSIREKRLENQRLQFETKARQEQKRIAQLEKETADMQYYGLWQSIDQIQTELDMIKTSKEKEEALKTQLRFRKHVFQQKADSEVYAFSKVVNGKRVGLSVDELKENVSKLVTGAFFIETNGRQDNNDGSLLVGKRVKQKFLDEAENPFWSVGKVISQVPGFPRWYNIVYDNDEAVYSDNLADHYRAGDLQILTDQ